MFIPLHKIKYLLLALFMLGGLAHSGISLAQDEPIVSAVDVSGNETVSRQTILSQIRTVAGQPLSSAELSEDLKRLYSLGYFKDVQIKQDKHDVNQVKVTFVVKEKPVLRAIEILGNIQIKTPDIQKAMKASVGDFVDEQIIRRDVDGVRKLYEGKGFFQAKITYKLEFDATVNQASLTINIDEGTKLIVKDIKFEGVYWLKPKDIRKKLETKTHGWFGLVPGTLKEDVLELDLQRARAYYDEEGFSDAKVTHRIEPLAKAGDVNLIFIIEEGKQYLVGDVMFENNQLFSDSELIEVVTLKPDSPFSRRGLRQSVTNIQDKYFEKGYMNARVSFDSSFNDTTGRVDTKYHVTEGGITNVRQVKIKGNAKTRDVVIRRELRVYPGEPFNGAALKKSKQRLFNLGYFDEVQFDTVDTEDPDEKDLDVSVKESKTGEFSFGGGFSSIDRAVGFVQVRQRNFDATNWPTFTGAGQDLALRLQIGSVRSQGELSWTDPWFLGYPFSFGFDVYRREFERTRSSGLFFDEERTGGRLRVGKELTDYDRINAFYGFERVNIDGIPDEASPDLKAEEGETDLSRVGVTLTRDTRDNNFVPTEGYLLQGATELVGGPFGGDRDFWRLTGLAANYWEPIDEQVLELKLRAGIADAYDNTERVPIFERFYAGGANTVRGYRERRIGPRDPGTKDPIGGDSYWVGNAEYTFPIVQDILKGAAFYDMGAVGAEIGDLTSAAVFSGVGLGVRIKTPIGPIKVDAGYPLDSEEDEDKEVRFYFNMSRGF